MLLPVMMMLAPVADAMLSPSPSFNRVRVLLVVLAKVMTLPMLFLNYLKRYKKKFFRT